MRYSNPKRSVSFTDWPYGNLHTTCSFNVEVKASTGKERAVRITVNPKNGRVNKPKCTVYSIKIIFVEGDDGRLYIIRDQGGWFEVIYSDLVRSKETVWPRSSKYDHIVSLFKEAAL